MNWNSLIDYDMLPDGDLGVELWWAQYEYNAGFVQDGSFVGRLNCIFSEMIKDKPLELRRLEVE